MPIKAWVFVGEFAAGRSKAASVDFLVMPRIGESIQLRLPGFADDVVGKIGKVIHTTSLDDGKPEIYVAIIPGKL